MPAPVVWASTDPEQPRSERVNRAGRRRASLVYRTSRRPLSARLAAGRPDYRVGAGSKDGEKKRTPCAAPGGRLCSRLIRQWAVLNRRNAMKTIQLNAFLPCEPAPPGRRAPLMRYTEMIYIGQKHWRPTSPPMPGWILLLALHGPTAWKAGSEKLITSASSE